MTSQDKLLVINHELELIIQKAEFLEQEYHALIEKVHPSYRQSALNLTHYLAFRSFHIDNLQDRLRYLGLPDLADIEGHVMKSLLTIKTIINHLLGDPSFEKRKGVISVKRSEKLLAKHTKQLFGYKSLKRNTRIMVTLPTEAANDYYLVSHLIHLGMNSARINCAHDNPEVWENMISNVKKANAAQHKKCKIMMDLAGPKLRTGAMKQGPMVIHLKPHKDQLGRVTKPSLVWLAPSHCPPRGNKADAIVPVNETLIEQIRPGDVVKFADSRGKKCKIIIEKRKGNGAWGSCVNSAYITSGTEVVIQRVKNTGTEKHYVGELHHKEEFITLSVGDYLILHKAQIPGEAAQYDQDGIMIKPAHIACTLPEVFLFVEVNDPVSLNDGKIEGVIESVNDDELKLRVTYAKISGSKLKADKGINFPESDLHISGLTQKDKEDLDFVALNADAVNLSFVNNSSDVETYFAALAKYEAQPGLILKIETQKGFLNLPKILLSAMQSRPVGVMIARGDLAIETGWKNFASIQEEIMRISEAAHLPVVWATQVLDNMAKKGVPTRSEITDAALAQRTECVMLNKGPYIEKTVKTLDKILRRMQKFQQKKLTILPKLEEADHLNLSHEKFNV